MPKTDTDPLGEGFKWRLRAQLDRVTPRYSPPRYLAPARGRIGAWRFAPVGLAAGVVGMLGLTAYAATGSPNPAVWTQQIVTRIGPGEAQPPSPSAEPSEHPAAPEASDGDRPPTARPEPTATSEPTVRTQPNESPEPGDGEQSGSRGDR